MYIFKAIIRHIADMPTRFGQFVNFYFFHEMFFSDCLDIVYIADCYLRSAVDNNGKAEIYMRSFLVMKIYSV